LYRKVFQKEFVDHYFQDNTVFNIGNEVTETSNTTNDYSNGMSEEQQIRLAQRLGLIQHLPSGTFDGSKKKRE